MNQFSLRVMTIEDYDVVHELWKSTPGIGLNASDHRDAIAKFLQRNPGLSAVVLSPKDGIVGAVLCGHDGRRGTLHHLAVLPAFRNLGLGRQLVEHCLARLRTEQIHKCNIFLFRNNASGSAFWRHNHWVTRDDLAVLQYVLLPCPT
jgi:N-acetylglutamate synthase